jgi:hypothetical protein
MADHDPTGVEVDVLPPEAQQLASAQTCGRQQ